MCAYSAVGDYWGRTLPERPYYPAIQPLISSPNTHVAPITVGIPREEFDALKRDVDELKKLLTEAKQFDEATGQPDCEVEEKVELIRKVAKLVGVEIEI